jgi:AraC-like DNA-binding protein
MHRPTDRAHASSIDPASGWIEAFILLDAGLARELVRHGALGDGRPVHPAVVDAGWCAALLAAQRDLARCPDGMLGEVLGRLVALASAACRGSDPAAEGEHAGTIAAACAALADGRSGQLDAIAAAAGISRDRLGRLFRASTGMSPETWRLRRLADRAKGMLIEPGATVASVARATGYADAAAFSHAFKRTTGMSPAVWRRRAGSAPRPGA